MTGGSFMTESEHYDAIIIGAGQSGVPLSTALAGAGWKTALIEEKHVGGTCINEGCTPTKTMVASARVAYLTRRTADYGVHAGPVNVNMEEVRQRKRDIVKEFRQSNLNRIEESGAELLMGTATFTGPDAVALRLNGGGMRRLFGEKIFINTGARPRIPQISGLENVRYLNSTSIMELARLPEHLLIIGGGYVGVEFGQMFRRFGSQVTVVQRSEQLLTREDADVAEAVADILREDGIQILFNSQPVQVEEQEGEIRLALNTADGEQTLTGTDLLIATGRVPNTEKLMPAAAGIKTDERGHIQVNDRLETNVANIYATGDVKGGPAFTHISYDDFRVLRTNLLEGGSMSIKDRMVPYTVFMDPQLGRVGLSEAQAREQGLNVQVAKMPMNYVARALEVDETRGFMKVVVDADSQQILGCAILGIQGGEIMGAIEIAMLGKLPYTALRDAVFAHPTLVESLNNLFARLEEG
jgi:pyruvate/2-oxoglutarate dehydrogenase complex dihydrolipoamide dehydrogenase (E3) component